MLWFALICYDLLWFAPLTAPLIRFSDNRFGWGEYAGLVEQVIRDPDGLKTVGFSTRSGVVGGGVYGSSAALESGRFWSGTDGISLLSTSGSRWCFESGRGVVGDFGASGAGLCSVSTSDGVCFVWFGGGVGGTGRSGCVAWTSVVPTLTAAFMEVNVSGYGDGRVFVDWDSGGGSGGIVDQYEPPTSSGLLRCWLRNSDANANADNNNNRERVCLVGGATGGRTPRNVFSSYYVAPYGEEEIRGGSSSSSSGGPPAKMLSSVLSVMCGCRPGEIVEGSIRWPWELCRSNSGSSSCYVDLGGACSADTGDFNCGTQYGWNNVSGSLDTSGFLRDSSINSTRYLFLCSGCSTGTTGQCRTELDGSCYGVNRDGTCPGTSELCVDRPGDVVWAAGVGAGYIDGIDSGSAAAVAGVTTLATAITSLGGGFAGFLWTDFVSGAVYDLLGVFHDPISSVATGAPAVGSLSSSSDVSAAPSFLPTGTPTGVPTTSPSGAPTGVPTGVPTGTPTMVPTGAPSGVPTGSPTATCTAYSWYRFEVTSTESSSTSRVSEFRLYAYDLTPIPTTPAPGVFYWASGACGGVTWALFDDDTGTEWECVSWSPATSAIVNLGTPVSAALYTWVTGSSGDDANNPDGWVVYGSNDGSAWTVLDTVSGYSGTPASRSTWIGENFNLDENGHCGTPSPTGVPTTGTPTGSPTGAPTGVPTTGTPTTSPTGIPTTVPTGSPSGIPTRAPFDVVGGRDGSGDLFMRLRRWIPDVVSSPSGPDPLTYDAVNCVAVEYGSSSSSSGSSSSSRWRTVVENPSYLSTATTASGGTSDFPGSLTEAALDVWCSAPGGGGCVGESSPRKYLCVDIGQTSITASGTGGGGGSTRGPCVVRRVQRAVYTSYVDPTGQTRGTYSQTSRPELNPDCYSWVSGLSPDWDCQRPDVFTGCVITETASHRATSGSNGNGGTNGAIYEPYAVDVTAPGVISLFVTTSDIFTCRSACRANVSCQIWWWEGSMSSSSLSSTHSGSPGGVCRGFIGSLSAGTTLIPRGTRIWPVESGRRSVVGTAMWSASAGFSIPRVHAGPVLGGPPNGIRVTLYRVVGGDFYLHDSVEVGGTTGTNAIPTTGVWGTYGCSRTGFPTASVSSECRGNRTAVGWLTYYGYPPGESSGMIGVHRVSCSAARVELLSSSTVVSEYGFAGLTSTTVSSMARVTLSTAVWMVGLLEEDPEVGFESTVYPSDTGANSSGIGGGRGLRGVWSSGAGVPGVESVGTTTNGFSVRVVRRGGVGTVVVGTTLSRWRYVVSTPAVRQWVSPALAGVFQRTCVPLTIRIGIDETTFGARAADNEIYRRDPIDCVVAGSLVADTDVNQGLFGPGGVCEGQQQLDWPSGLSASSGGSSGSSSSSSSGSSSARNIDNDAGYVTNIR